MLATLLKMSAIQKRKVLKVRLKMSRLELKRPRKSKQMLNTLILWRRMVLRARIWNKLTGGKKKGRSPAIDVTEITQMPPF